MGKKRKMIYECLVAGAAKGLSGRELYEFVAERFPKASSRKIVRAALLGLMEDNTADRNVIDVVYGLAIRHRLDEVKPGEDLDDDDIFVSDLKKSRGGQNLADPRHV